MEVDNRNTSDARPVLVIARGALGDVLIGFQFLSAIPGFFRTTGLSLVSSPAINGIFRPLDFVSAVKDQNQADWAGLYLDPPDVPQRLYDFISSHKAAVVFASGDNDVAALGLRKLGLDVMIAPPRPPAGVRIHTLDYMFRKTGIGRPAKWTLTASAPEDAAEAEKYASAAGLDNRRWIAMHPGSGSETKNWPLDNWLFTARYMHSKYDVASVFLLGWAEDDVAARLQNSGISSFATIARNLPLPVLGALLRRAEAYIGHDSGVSHLAAATGAPTLAIFGPTDHAVWAPAGPRAAAVFREKEEGADGFEWPGVDEVIEKLEAIIKKA